MLSSGGKCNAARERWAGGWIWDAWTGKSSFTRATRRSVATKLCESTSFDASERRLPIGDSSAVVNNSRRVSSRRSLSVPVVRNSHDGQPHCPSGRPIFGRAVFCRCAIWSLAATWRRRRRIHCSTSTKEQRSGHELPRNARQSPSSPVSFWSSTLTRRLSTFRMLANFYHYCACVYRFSGGIYSI